MTAYPCLYRRPHVGEPVMIQPAHQPAGTRGVHVPAAQPHPDARVVTRRPCLRDEVYPGGTATGRTYMAWRSRVEGYILDGEFQEAQPARTQVERELGELAERYLASLPDVEGLW